MSNSVDARDLNGSMILLPDEEEKTKTYNFLDPIVQYQCQSRDVSVRQIVSKNDFERLAEARERMYSQRKRYYQTLFDSNAYLEESDFRSYILAFYHKGEIIGSQRVTPYPFEVSNYISESRLDTFLGRYHQFTTVEFSRLVVDRHAPVKGVADALGRTAGTLVTLIPRFTQYITYSRPHLKRKAFIFEGETITFKIPARGDHDYELFKGSLLKDLCGYYQINPSNIPKSLDDLILQKEYESCETDEISEAVNE